MNLNDRWEYHVVRDTETHLPHINSCIKEGWQIVQTEMFAGSYGQHVSTMALMRRIRGFGDQTPDPTNDTYTAFGEDRRLD